MILVIDNYDSFTYNLVQYLQQLGSPVEVYRHDAISVQNIREKNPKGILISPGPGRPENAGISMDVVRAFVHEIPLFGVCLGHQCIALHFGGKIIRAYRLMHGKTSMIKHDGQGVLKGIPSPFQATRYHSLIVDSNMYGKNDLQVSAWTDEGEIMGLRHRRYLVESVQFHPESFLTKHGHDLLKNWLTML